MEHRIYHSCLNVKYYLLGVVKDREQLYGLIVSENAVSITLRLAGGVTRNILRIDIASLESTNRSLMPEGWEDSLTLQDLADLIAFIKSEP